MQEESEKASSKGKPLREQAAQWLDEEKETAAAKQPGRKEDPAKKILIKHADLEINYDKDFQNKKIPQVILDLFALFDTARNGQLNAEELGEAAFAGNSSVSRVSERKLLRYFIRNFS